MRYVWLNNFRGFSETLIPVSQVNFLVGENSSGKSSFLKIFHMLSNINFWISPTFVGYEGHDFGGFKDIVSASADDRSYFEVGMVNIDENKINSFRILKFVESSDNPVISRCSIFENEANITIVYEKKRTKFSVDGIIFAEMSSEKEVVDEVVSFLQSERQKTRGFVVMPDLIKPYSPIPILISIIRQSQESVQGDRAKMSLEDFSSALPSVQEVTWIAPIRSKPKRFYDGLEQNFTPEGDHAPYVIRRILRGSVVSNEFLVKIAEFGKLSGLFETVKAHSFGNKHQSPFEILIKISGGELNINNVGYGVSQVLPLIIEFLTHSSKTTFAVQQPEVHLHPKAQAALGDLIFELATDSKFSFVLETHSDYLIDRFRLAMKKSKSKPPTSVLFFNRENNENKVYQIAVDDNGRYKLPIPKDFKDFFIKEEMQLLDL